MTSVPSSLRPRLRRLRRRLTIGLFLDVWPIWTVASLLLAGLIALVCRLFVPAAAPYLAWLWLAPLVAAIPVLILCVMRKYHPEEVVAIADWLNGGHGLMLTLMEHPDEAWGGRLDGASTFALPQLRPWRRLAWLPAALAFLAVALSLPQRIPPASTTVLAEEIAGDLETALAELKQQQLVTPEEEKTLEQEIERIRRAAEQRVDASSWEATDALRERVAATVAAKQDAVKWAEETLARYAAAAQAAPGGEVKPGAETAELTRALENLAKSGLLANAPPDLQQLLRGGKLPAADPKAMRELAAVVSKYLAETKGRMGDLARMGKEFGRFDPSEFPLESNDSGPDGDGDPGRGGINRGRGDAPLTWGNESLPLDRFKAQALPPGAARSPDDWAPMAAMPGTPQESPESSARSAARQYGAGAGQAAWRRTLAPRHQSAVKKYFDK
jgi:hypothetical protein